MTDLPKSRPSVMIGYPVGASVTLPFHAALLRLQAYELRKGAGRLLSEIQHASSPLVGENRQALVEYFLETEAEWLLMIDTDVSFPPDLIERVLEIAGARRVLAASVPPGTTHGATSAYAQGWTPGSFRPIRWVPREPVEVDAVDAGALLVHREVYETIAAREGRTWFCHIYIPTTDPADTPRSELRYGSLGEDYAFSVRARLAGHRLWCVHVPGVKHHKARPLSHDDEDTLFYRAWLDDGAPLHGGEVAIHSANGEPVIVRVRKLSLRELERARETAEQDVTGVTAGAPLPPLAHDDYDSAEVLRAGVEGWSSPVPLHEGLAALDPADAERLRGMILDLSLPRPKVDDSEQL